MPSVVISARGEQRVRGGHPWIYRADVVDVRCRRRRHRPGDRSAQADDRPRAVQRSVADPDPDADARRRRRPTRRCCARGCSARFASASRCSSTRRRIGSCTARPTCCRRSIVDRYGDYLVVQALSQGMDRLLPTITAAAGGAARAGRHPRAQRSEGAGARRARADGRGAGTARFPTRSSCAKGRSSTRSICDAGRRPACSSISARTARRRRATRAAGCSTASATTADSRCGWRRQCTEAEAIDISADAVARIRANAARNGVPHLKAREANVFDELRRLERAGRALRHDRARPAGVREEQGVGAERARRLQGDQPARDAAARRRAARWSRAAAPTTSTRRCSAPCCTRRRSTATRR